MREKINKLSKGIVEDITPFIKIEPESLKVSLRPGEIFRFDISLSSDNGFYIKGLAYSDDSRIIVTPAAFGGQTVHLVVEVDCHLTDSDEILQGHIDLVTNAGERTIPYDFTSMTINVENTLREMSSIDDFAEIAKQDADLALKIFEYKNFRIAPFMNNPRNQALHKAFLGRNNKKLALQEFLKAAGSKADINLGINLKNDEPSNVIDISNEFDTSYTDNNDRDHNDNFFSDRERFYQKHLIKYTKLRLLYEISKSTDYTLLDSMLDELSKITSFPGKEAYISLHRALVYLDMGKKERAQALLDSVREEIINNRQEMLDEYFLFEYIKCLLNRKSDKTASFIRLLNKFISEENMHSVFYYIVNLDDKLIADTPKYSTFLKNIYNDGNICPFLYLYYCRLLNDHPEYLHDIDDFDMHALNFGARYDILNSEVRKIVAARAGNIKSSLKLYNCTLSHMADNHDDQYLVNAICMSLIREDNRSQLAHKWYEKAIENGSELNGIYEYFMYSFGDTDESRIPEKVLLHYIEDDSLDLSNKLILYSNIVRFEDKESAIYKAYLSRITYFALNQLRNKSINKRLADIYKEVLTPNLIDSQTANVLPYILNSYRLECISKDYRSIVVIYPQIDNEQLQMLSNGEAYLPIYNNDAVLLFQDNYGNRYYDVNYSKEKLIDNPKLIAFVNSFAPDNITANLEKLTDIVSKSSHDSSDTSYIKHALIQLPLANGFRRMLYSKLSPVDKDREFLSKLQGMDFIPEERPGYITDLINAGMYNEAFSLLKSFGDSGVNKESICKLCSNLILNRMFYEDSLLTLLSSKAALEGYYDTVTLDYLCEHYNGCCRNMYTILAEAVKSQVETYDLEERLLAQEIFCNESQYIDKVFEYYVSRKKASETIIKAYFTTKTAAYFLYNSTTDKQVFEYLESILRKSDDINNLPEIYKLSLTKYYSEIEELDDERKQYATEFVQSLFNNGLVFRHFKALGSQIDIPAEIRNSEIMEYKANSKEIILLESRTIPVGRDYQQDAFSLVYHNIHVKQILLFYGETWEYRIYDDAFGSKDLKSKGSVQYNHRHDFNTGSRFETLNNIAELKDKGEENKLHEAMNEYVYASKVNDSLFRTV